MSTEIDVRRNGHLAEVPVAPTLAPATADLIAWADSARAAHEIAVNLAQTSFVPKAFQNKPGECTAAILTGHEMGLSPMASLRSFDLIQGTPAMRANAMRGVVQSHGHEIWEEKVSPTKVIVCGQRKGSDKVHRSEWTIERARDLQLLGKDNWKKQPQAMLVARATSEACRLTASDVLYGVPYSAEELADVTGEAKPASKARRRLAPVAPPEPDFPAQGEQPAPDEATEPEPEGEPDEQAELPNEPDPTFPPDEH